MFHNERCLYRWLCHGRTAAATLCAETERLVECPRDIIRTGERAEIERRNKREKRQEPPLRVFPLTHACYGFRWTASEKEITVFERNVQGLQTICFVDDLTNKLSAYRLSVCAVVTVSKASNGSAGSSFAPWWEMNVNVWPWHGISCRSSSDSGVEPPQARTMCSKSWGAGGIRYALGKVTTYLKQKSSYSISYGLWCELMAGPDPLLCSYTALVSAAGTHWQWRLCYRYSAHYGILNSCEEYKASVLG